MFTSVFYNDLMRQIRNKGIWCVNATTDILFGLDLKMEFSICGWKFIWISLFSIWEPIFWDDNSFENPHFPLNIPKTKGMQLEIEKRILNFKSNPKRREPSYVLLVKVILFLCFWTFAFLSSFVLWLAYWMNFNHASESNF